MIKGRQLSDAKFQIDALDGFRGLAVLLVFLSHTSNQDIFLIPWLDFSGKGKAGVFLFFILSSFLLTYPFLDKKAAAFSRPFLQNYALRRFFRVFPLYLVFLLVSLLSSAVLYRIFSLDQPSGIPITLTPMEFVNHVLLIEGKSITWSIAVEFKFYFILPVLAYMFSIVLGARMLPTLLLTTLLIAVVQAWIPQHSSHPNDIRVVPYLPIFFIGAFLAVCQYRWNQNRDYLTKKYKLPLQLLGIAVAGLIVIMTPSVYEFVNETSIGYDFFHRNFIEYGVLWGIAIFCIVNGGGVLRTFFESRLLRYLGYISFSVYLLHMTVIRLLQVVIPDTAAHWLYGWLILALTIGLSQLSFIFLERPFSRIKWGQVRTSKKVVSLPAASHRGGS